MPFRHLLFNRRNGAPQRAPDQQAITLDSVLNFSIDNEFPTYQRWPEDNYTTQPSPSAYHTTMMQDNQLAKQQNSIYSHPYDQTSMFPYTPTNSIPYQNLPYDFDSSSLFSRNSSDLMDTDVSSISQGSMHSSISSASHLDVMRDDDMKSLHSLSRKPSVITNYAHEGNTSQICPALLTGGKCDPSLCGPDAPCLQFVNEVPPIEECVPESTRQESIDSVNNQPIDFTTPHTSPQQHRQPRSAEQGPTDDDKKSRLRSRRSMTKVIVSDTKDDVPATKQIKKSRARQAHSLVERKYRENLNAKIQELHQTLQRVQYGKSSNQQMLDQEEEGDDDVDDQDRASSKVKKSDVLIEAMNYVRSTDIELRQKDEEIERLNQRIGMIESWLRNGNVGHGGLM